MLSTHGFGTPPAAAVRVSFVPKRQGFKPRHWVADLARSKHSTL